MSNGIDKSVGWIACLEFYLRQPIYFSAKNVTAIRFNAFNDGNLALVRTNDGNETLVFMREGEFLEAVDKIHEFKRGEDED